MSVLCIQRGGSGDDGVFRMTDVIDRNDDAFFSAEDGDFPRKTCPGPQTKCDLNS